MRQDGERLAGHGETGEIERDRPEREVRPRENDVSGGYETVVQILPGVAKGLGKVLSIRALASVAAPESMLER